ncbi:MAG TPA: hypothetical protein VF306_12595 [Pirellulales bacterium]
MAVYIDGYFAPPFLAISGFCWHAYGVPAEAGDGDRVEASRFLETSVSNRPGKPVAWDDSTRNGTNTR